MEKVWELECKSFMPGASPYRCSLMQVSEGYLLCSAAGPVAACNVTYEHRLVSVPVYWVGYVLIKVDLPHYCHI